MDKATTTKRDFWLLDLDNFEPTAWLKEAEKTQASSMEAAVRQLGTDILEDDGTMTFAVADNPEGVGARKFSVTCEVTYSFEVQALGPTEVGEAAELEDKGLAVPKGICDDRTLPMWETNE